ncbi:MAG: phosphoribosyl-AMP cyclohydrolase [Pseudomonadales bacterium]
MPDTAFLDDIKWDATGLVPAIAQDYRNQRVLMVAWMDRAALAETVQSGQAVYYSRSRQQLWRKGEQSGHVQYVKEIRLDCDADVITLLIEQKGGIACHTGRASCFYRKLEDRQWRSVEPVLKDPKKIYST